MPIYEIRIDPIDPMLFGDNRSARGGFDHVLRDQDPSPLTLHGAIGQYIERRTEGRWPRELLGERQSDVLKPGPKIAELRGFCLHGPGGGLYFPRPRHLRCTLHDGKPRPVDLLAPRKLEGSMSSSSGLRLLLPTDDEALADEAEGDLLLRESDLEKVLCGEVPASAELPSELFQSEPRPGIAVDNDSATVIEGQFFTRPYRRFRTALSGQGARTGPAGFAVWFETLAPVTLDLADRVGFLGGDRRRARFEIDCCEEPLGELRERVAEAAAQNESSGFLLALLTPALQVGTEVEAEGMPAVAAALGKPVYGSGWNVEARRPREIHTLVPPGSVYFFEWPSGAPPGQARAELVRRLWLHALRPRGAAAGFGRCLPGIWP